MSLYSWSCDRLAANPTAFLYQVFSDFRKINAFSKVSRFRPFILRVRTICRYCNESKNAHRCIKVSYITNTFSYLLTYLFTYLLTWLLTYLLSYLLTSYLLTYILTHSLTYLLTYLLTPRSRVLEKQTGSQLVKKFPAFYRTRKFITEFTTARQLSLSWASILCILCFNYTIILHIYVWSFVCYITHWLNSRSCIIQNWLAPNRQTIYLLIKHSMFVT